MTLWSSLKKNATELVFQGQPQHPKRSPPVPCRLSSQRTKLCNTSQGKKKKKKQIQKIQQSHFFKKKKKKRKAWKESKQTRAEQWYSVVNTQQQRVPVSQLLKTLGSKSCSLMDAAAKMIPADPDRLRLGGKLRPIPSIPPQLSSLLHQIRTRREQTD